MGLLVLAVGGFITGIGLGVVSVPEESIHAPRWVIAAAGLAFFFAGIAVLQQAFQIESLKYVPGVAILIALAATAHWAAFAPGAGGGEGVLTIVGIPIPVSSETAGRIGFGFGAVLMDVLFVVGLIHWIRGGRGNAPRTRGAKLPPRSRPIAPRSTMR